MNEKINNLFFFTATCLNWKHLIHQDSTKLFLINSLNYYTEKSICRIYGFVIMPNHIHLIIAINNEQRNYFQHSYLKFTAQTIIGEWRNNKSILLNSIKSTQADRKFQFWERNPKWKSIQTDESFWKTLRYIHDNPTQEHWKLVENAEDYMMSSAKCYLKGNSEFTCLTIYCP